MDPVNHPEPGSETASLFSLDDEDLKKLKHPSFATLSRDVMPSYIANWLFKDHSPGITDLKCDSGDAEDSCILKHHCMDGDNLQLHAMDISTDLQFTQLLYEMEDWDDSSSTLPK